jgi:outer membrane protein
VKNKICFLFAALVILLALHVPAARAQALKIGFVNSSKILQEFSEAQDVNKKLDAMAQAWQAEFEKMSKDFEAKFQDYKKKEGLMPDAEKRAAQEDLALMEQRGVAFRQQKFGSNGELAIATDSLLGPVKKKVLKVIEQAAKEEKLQFIFDRNDQITVLLYGDQKFDYTNYIIDKLKRGTPTKSGKE